MTQILTHSLAHRFLTPQRIVGREGMGARSVRQGHTLLWYMTQRGVMRRMTRLPPTRQKCKQQTFPSTVRFLIVIVMNQNVENDMQGPHSMYMAFYLNQMEVRTALQTSRSS